MFLNSCRYYIRFLHIGQYVMHLHCSPGLALLSLTRTQTSEKKTYLDSCCSFLVNITFLFYQCTNEIRFIALLGGETKLTNN